MSEPRIPVQWICPWGICNQQQAQECRAETNPRKGCGGRFPANMTPEQAKESIKRPDPTFGSY